MNELISRMIERRTIRKYRPEQVRKEDLDAILQAGLSAPSAGGRQSAIIVVCQNAELNNELGQINHGIMNIGTPEMGRVSAEQPSILDDANIRSAFYYAPTVLTLFAPKDIYNQTGDCFVAAENIIIAAHFLGVGSCMVARATETFATPRGKEIQKEWGIDESYQARIHVTLGYPEGSLPKHKERKEGRVIIIGQ